MAKLKIQTTPQNVGGALATQPTNDKFISPILVGGAHIGGTGGNTAQSGYQIQAQVKVGSNAATTGFIVAQKGAHKFRVTDANGNSGTCTLANIATPTVNNTMSVAINTAVLTSANANAMVASGSSTNAYVTGFTVAGPVALAVGQTVTGTGATGTVTITAINGAGNVTVGYSSQIFSNVAVGTFNTTVYASKLNNKYVWDFGNDGNPDSTTGTITFLPSGYNPNRYRYRLASPTATFVQVVSA
jgi:hypothetical protein